MAFDAAWSAVNRDEQEEVPIGASKSGISRRNRLDGMRNGTTGRELLGCFFLYIYILYILKKTIKLVKGDVFIGRYFVDSYLLQDFVDG